MLDPYATKPESEKSHKRTIESVFEIHKRTVKDRDDFGELTDLVLAHEGTPVLNQHGAPVYKSDTQYIRHLFDVYGEDDKLLHKKGDLFVNGKGRAQDRHSQPIDNTIFNSQPLTIEFTGIRDGLQSMPLHKHHEQLREARSVKGVTKNLKYYKDRELLKLLDKVNTEVRKRNLVMPAGYQPVEEGEWVEKIVPRNPPQGR